MKHEQLKLPKGDVLLCCGDFTRTGSQIEVIEFNTWLGRLDYKQKIVISGNQDQCLEDIDLDVKKIFSNATYLQDESCLIDGIHLYGSPWTPKFGEMAFNLKDQNHAKEIWEKIPENVEVLIVHGPAKGILDQTRSGVSAGCPELLARIIEVKPKIFVCGHIHESYGEVQQEGIKFINSAMLKNRVDVNLPIVFEL